MPVNVKEVKRRLAFLLKEERLVSEYLRRFGPVIDPKNIRAIKTEGEKAPAAPVEEEKGEDPIFEVKVQCPVCGQEGVCSYELKAKSQQVTENQLLQQKFIGAMGHRTVDYNLLAVAVCPRCLFASPDRKDFTGKVKITEKTIPSQLPPNAVMTLQEKIGERKALAEGVEDPEKYFRRPRTLEAALLSYQLAAARAKVEAYYEMQNSLYKLGAYSLKIARILKDQNKDETPALREAVEYFVECFKNSNVDNELLEYRLIYLIAILYLRLGDQRQAQSYLVVFDRIKNDLKTKARTDPTVNMGPLEKWEDKAKRLWEDRERDDLFKE